MALQLEGVQQWNFALAGGAALPSHAFISLSRDASWESAAEGEFNTCRQTVDTLSIPFLVVS